MPSVLFDPVDRFLTLDAMRGIAALAVVTYHIDKVNPLGFVAVDLFFILSGFVLCHAYGGRLSFGNFMMARLIRLYPMFFMGVLVGLVIRGGNPFAFVFVPDWDHVLLYPMNTALWSVTYELIASIGFALFYRFGLRAWLVFWFSSLTVWLSFILQFDAGSVGMHWAGVAIGMARMTFAFTTGIALHWIYKRIKLRKESHWAWLFCLAPVVVTLFGETPLVPLVFVFLPLVVIGGAIFEIPSKRFAKVSGDISYPLYAIHQPIVVLFGWVSVPFVLILAWILDRYFDRPVRKWLTNTVKARGAGSPAAA